MSPSQINLFRECPRRWGFRYIEGLSEPSDPQQQAGIDVHKVYEDWFKHEKTPDLNTRAGVIFMAGKKHYPAPSPELHVEHEARFEFDGVEYLMYLDLHYTGDDEGKHTLVDPVELVIDDHKTTSGLQWAKTEEQLLVDPQRVLYAFWGTLAYPLNWVRTRWVYHERKPPYTTRKVEVRQHRDEVLDLLPPVHATAKEIRKSAKLRVHDLETNVNACYAYNKPCPFMEKCQGKTTAFSRMKAIFAQAERAERAREDGVPPPMYMPEGKAREEGMGLLDTLKNGKGSAAGAIGMDPAKVREEYDRQEAANATPPAAEEEPAPAAAPASGVLAQLRSGKKPTPTAEPEPPPSTGLLAELKGQVVEEQPTPEKKPRGKKQDAESTGGVLKIGIADERTARVVLHAIGILMGRDVEFVKEHVKAALTP